MTGKQSVLLFNFFQVLKMFGYDPQIYEFVRFICTEDNDLIPQRYFEISLEIDEIDYEGIQKYLKMINKNNLKNQKK